MLPWGLRWEIRLLNCYWKWKTPLFWDWDGNLKAHSRRGCRGRSFDCGTKQVYKTFMKSVVSFLWPTRLRNVNLKEFCVFTDSVTCWKIFFHIPNAPAIFYGHHYSFPAVSCHNIFFLTVPVQFTLSTPCFPCPMLFDMHISSSHKWPLLV